MTGDSWHVDAQLLFSTIPTSARCCRFVSIYYHILIIFCKLYCMTENLREGGWPNSCLSCKKITFFSYEVLLFCEFLIFDKTFSIVMLVTKANTYYIHTLKMFVKGIWKNGETIFSQQSFGVRLHSVCGTFWHRLHKF